MTKSGVLQRRKATRTLPDAPIEPAPERRASGPRLIDSGWRHWIAESKLRQCPHDPMLSAMRNAGPDPAECALAIERMEHDPAFLAAQKMQQLQRRLESVL